MSRKVWIPQMASGSALLFAAALRGAGLDADVCPADDERSLALASRHTSGEECLPARLTLGGFLRVTERLDFDPDRTIFFMPTADGPCRFGQYAPYLRKVLRDLSLDGVLVLAPSSRDGYAGLGESGALMRTLLCGLACADILRKRLHRTRPYEVARGDADRVHEESVAAIARVFEHTTLSARERARQAEARMRDARDRFRRVPARYSRRRPLIGVVGEIFCRLTDPVGETIIRKVEGLGAECTLSHMLEWVWYTNLEHQKRLRHQGRAFSRAMLAAKMRAYVQRWQEHRLVRIFSADFRGYEEPPIEEIFKNAGPFLPHSGALGEMTLNVGKTISYYQQGCDGVVDVAPFGCMNGIVTEAVYPTVSAKFDGFPIRSVFVDGTSSDLDRDLSIFVEFARSYHVRKKVARTFPADFPSQ